MNTVGIDVGSSSIKTALMKFDDQGQSESLLSCDYEKIRKRNIKDVILESFKRTLQKHALQETDIEYVASTGEGELVDFRRGHFYSMTCHSRGALYLNPTVRAVMDLGALHSKVVLMDDRSKVLDYRMTSQCASGSGQFLENISRYLGVATEDIGELSLQADKPETVSGICAVLAETDVINMVSRGISTSNIIKGIHISMARRLVNLLRMIKAQGRVLTTGGLAQDEGLLNTIQEMLDKEDKKIKILKHELSPFAGAIGAALWAGFRNVKLHGAEKSTSKKSTRMIYGGLEVKQEQQLTSSLALGEVKKNIGSLLLENKSHYKTYHAFAERVNGKYFYWTWEDLVKDIFLVSQFLISKGLHTGDRVAFVTANSYFRLISEMAVMSLGLISVPVFAGYPKELISDLIEFSEIKMLFVDVFNQIRLLSFDQQLPELVIFKKPNESDFPRNLQEKITYLDASILQKKLTVSAEIEKRFCEAKPHQTALIMYTSGTTGFPKGVQLSHYNLLSQQKALELLFAVAP
ncbi:MAG: benzoyl-CoA reductase subunit D [Deltaproteobacteria bacterium]|nr:benzoyl-CoA reductase subunit D [Deltaproteobacteria bacterium]